MVIAVLNLAMFIKPRNDTTNTINPFDRITEIKVISRRYIVKDIVELEVFSSPLGSFWENFA
jgi:hypothetical protein